MPYPRHGITPNDGLDMAIRMMPAAIAWAEAEVKATRMARAVNLNIAVRTGRCAVGDQWAMAPREGCGYCANTARHAVMWAPPDPTTIVIGCA